MTIASAFKNNRIMKSLTGMSIREFELLLQLFEAIYYESLINKTRQRAIGGGRKGALADVSKKLFFILFYMRPLAKLGFGLKYSATIRFALGSVK